MERMRLLEIIEKNADYTIADLAKILQESEAAISEEMEKLISEKIILGRHTVINWDKANKDKVMAFIEIGITPERETGYDSIASRIYKYEEVSDCFLMSGTFDLIVKIDGMNMKEIANFVAMKLATIENVKSTATYFVLKTYKHNSVVFSETKNKQERVEIS